jgi:hypothetical protein
MPSDLFSFFDTRLKSWIKPFVCGGSALDSRQLKHLVIATDDEIRPLTLRKVG